MDATRQLPRGEGMRSGTNLVSWCGHLGFDRRGANSRIGLDIDGSNRFRRPHVFISGNLTDPSHTQLGGTTFNTKSINSRIRTWSGPDEGGLDDSWPQGMTDPEVAMARHSEGDTTSPTLIGRVGDWRDHDAWSDFVRRYGPTVRLYCRTFALDSDTLDDLMQQIWIDLAHRLKTYRYDPSKTFRGWLSRVCRSRAIDVIRKRKAGACPAFQPAGESAFGVASFDDAFADEPPDDDRPDFFRCAEAIQAGVKGRVDDRTWTAFWQIVVEAQPVRETADSLGLSYAAAFAAQKRVRRMLHDEGERFLLDRNRESPGSES